jgi:phage terminase large subunit-like protein
LRSAFFDCAGSAARLPETLSEFLADLDDDALAFLVRDWELWARDDQLPPDAADGRDWRTWLILGGRGAGKTRAGAEWVRAIATHPPTGGDPPRIALVGETMQDARSVMVEGVSGLLAIHEDAERPRFEPSKHQLVWPGGAVAQLFSAEDPDSLRGPQFHAAWCDEIAKWRRAEETWDMLQFALRLGSDPRQVVTTTPRPLPLLQRILADAATVTTRSRTADNSTNLAPSFLSEMQRRYAGTVLGRQELDGEIVEERAGALWRQDWIEDHRVAAAPALARIVVAVDPPVTSSSRADACGIVVAGLGEDRRAYVLADRSLKGIDPQTWAHAAIAAYHDFSADRIVAEVNQGGDLVAEVMRHVDQSVPVGKVRATRGKWVRAEPVAALYAEGRVAHVGRLPALETEMLALGRDGRAEGHSPDRLDALVWAITELMLEQPGAPQIRPL